MRDLNDMFFFAEVVANGGFAPAGRALNQPKSKLSRRVSRLEAELGVRLIERSSRRFRVTEIGQAFYDRCRTILAEAAQAEAAVAQAQGEPRGLVRFSCPTGLLEPVASLLSEFMAAYPRVALQVIATDRRVDLIEERIDVALRVRSVLDSDAALTLRVLARNHRILVASPAVARQAQQRGDISALASFPTLTTSEQPGPDTWRLVGPEGRAHSLVHEPRLSCADFATVRKAAAAGLGVALLPDHSCAADLQTGRLVRLFPDFHAPEGIMHLVFTARRGLPPAVRAFIDHLAERFRGDPMNTPADATPGADAAFKTQISPTQGT